MQTNTTCLPHVMRWIPAILPATVLAASLLGCSSGPVTTTDVSNGTTDDAAPKTGADGDAGDHTPAENNVSDDPAPVTDPVKAEVTDLAGYEAVIAKHKGKVIVVDFWATWCEPCVERFPHIVELSHQFPADKVAFVSVSLDDAADAEKVTEFLTKEGAGGMTNLHSSLDVVEAFDAFNIADGIPNYKLYDTSGEVKYRFALAANEKLDVLAADELDIKLREMLK